MTKKYFSFFLTLLIAINVFMADVSYVVLAAENNYLGTYNQSTNFGIANDFNLFILGNHEQSNVDSEGRVAVGGNATYSNYAVGSKLARSTTRADLIIGGDVNISSAQNLNGNTVISTKSNIIKFGMDHPNGVTNPIRADVIDFGAVKTFLQNTAQKWSKYPTNGTAKITYGQLVLEGNDPKINVFSFNGNNIEGSGFSLNSIYQINIVVPEGSTTLINVSGNNIGFGNYTIFYKGNTATTANGQYFLWNFYEATSLWNSNLTIKGSILAPNADWVSKGYGNVEGNFIANSLSDGEDGSHIEAHNALFKGTIPDLDSPNNQPIVQNYSVTTPEDTAVSGKVVGTDKDGDSLTYRSITKPTNGTVVDDVYGKWTYTPNIHYVGKDSFKVEVSDGNGGTAISTITIDVTPVKVTPPSTPSTPSTPKKVVTEPKVDVPAAVKVKADFAVLIDASTMRAGENSTVKYTITYFDKLTTEVPNTFVKVNVPDRMTFVEADNNGKLVGNEVVWDIGTLKGNAKDKVSFTLKVKDIEEQEANVTLTAKIYTKYENIELINTSDDESKIDTFLFANETEFTHTRYILGYPDGNVKPKGPVTRAEVAVIFARILKLKDQGHVKGVKVFNDVDVNFWGAEHIEAVTEVGLFKGYKDNTFKPNQFITRAELATVISKYLKITTYPEYSVLTKYFTDISGHWAEANITEIYRYGIIKGYEDNTFRPNNTITREETITMVNQMLHRGPLTNVKPSFPDNLESNWSFGHVEEATNTHKSYYNENGSETLVKIIPEGIW